MLIFDAQIQERGSEDTDLLQVFALICRLKGTGTEDDLSTTTNCDAAITSAMDQGTGTKHAIVEDDKKLL